MTQCRQCSEAYPRATLCCPRCGRLNNSNGIIVGFKLLIVVLFVGTAYWALRTAKSHESPPRGDSKPMPKEAPALPGQPGSAQPDLRF